MGHHVLPLVCTSLIVVSAVFVAIGWYLIKQGKRDTHRKVMLTASALALLFFVLYVGRTIFVGNTTFAEDAPDAASTFYYIFLPIHILLATVAGVFGIITLLHAFSKRFAKHKKMGRITAVLWLLTAPTGVLVYVLLYVLYPGGDTKPVIDAIFGW
ncbi:DUF420 domain-containing protein [Paenibacillus cymbidii]|uniref:DUF420 domain-containing protein n=1 Tax=Paenibacillus cymbidii TaxID=1639034 RepID=UPI0010802E08|nr:DUF420 domain-containing protein [Paenibacillus cymbidii]